MVILWHCTVMVFVTTDMVSSSIGITTYRVVDTLAMMASDSRGVVITARPSDHCLIDVECQPYHHLYHHSNKQVLVNSSSVIS